MERLDAKDEILLAMILDGASIAEMAAAALYASSKSVYDRLKYLEGQGLIAPPPKRNQPRSRKVTGKGLRYLMAIGLMTVEKARAYELVNGGIGGAAPGTGE